MAPGTDNACPTGVVSGIIVVDVDDHDREAPLFLLRRLPRRVQDVVSTSLSILVFLLKLNENSSP
jgi:hypothetical protein